MTFIGSELIKGKILIDNVIVKQIHRFVYLRCDTVTQKRKVRVKNSQMCYKFLNNTLKTHLIQRGTILKNYVKRSISAPSLRQ